MGGNSNSFAFYGVSCIFLIKIAPIFDTLGLATSSSKHLIVIPSNARTFLGFIGLSCSVSSTSLIILDRASGNFYWRKLALFLLRLLLEGESAEFVRRSFTYVGEDMS